MEENYIPNRFLIMVSEEKGMLEYQ